jgi:hypothetical protein
MPARLIVNPMGGLCTHLFKPNVRIELVAIAASAIVFRVHTFACKTSSAVANR